MQIAYAKVMGSARGRLCPRTTVIPPNRLEIRNWELLASLAARDGALDRFRDALRRMTGAQHIFFAPSARCAIAQVLSNLPCDEVVMPAYTCPVVKRAVEIASKKIIYVDIHKDGLNATSAEFEKAAKPGRVLIPTHLFGISTDIENICNLARDRGCLTIEDAAAGLGATRNGQMLGTFGDIGIFSFERSKRLPAFRGAAILVNNECLAHRMQPSKIAQTRHAIPFSEVARAILYNVATYPPVYGRTVLPVILQRYAARTSSADDELPEDPLESAFYTREFHPCQAALALRSIRRLSTIKQHIAAIVAVYREALDSSEVMTFRSLCCDEGGLLRFPIAFALAERAEALRMALARGLYLETNFEHPLVDPSQSEHFPNASWAADHVVLLPLYSRLTLDNAASIANRVVEIQQDLSRRKGRASERTYAHHGGA